MLRRTIRPVHDHRRGCREGIRAATEAHRLHPIPPVPLEGPYILEKRFFHADLADAAGTSGFERVDGQTVAALTYPIGRVTGMRTRHRYAILTPGPKLAQFFGGALGRRR